MEKVTTEDCKDFFINQFPHTEVKDWERISKKKNDNGLWVRKFVNSKSFIECSLLEENGNLSIFDNASNQVTQTSASPHDFTFVLYRDDPNNDWGLNASSNLCSLCH